MVVVTTSAWSKGEGMTPAATSPEMCAMSIMSSEPLASAISRNSSYSSFRSALPGEMVKPMAAQPNRSASSTLPVRQQESIGGPGTDALMEGLLRKESPVAASGAVRCAEAEDGGAMAARTQLLAESASSRKAKVAVCMTTALERGRP